MVYLHNTILSFENNAIIFNLEVTGTDDLTSCARIYNMSYT